MSLEPVRDDRGRWRRGVSGNPGGRPHETAERKRVRDLARECTEEAVSALRQIMLDPNAQTMGRVQAARALMDRGWGMPSDEATLDALDHSGDNVVRRFRFVMGEQDDDEAAGGDAA